MPGRDAIPLDFAIRPRSVRSRWLRRARRSLKAIALGLAGFAASAVIVVALARPSFVAHADRALVAAGFAVRDVSIRGATHTSEAEVRQALALDGNHSHLALDLTRLTASVEALPWVRRANIVRQLPDKLTVALTERKPAAVWRGVDRDVLVDAEGRTLGAIPRGAALGLPVLSGEGAGPASPGLLLLLADAANIEQRLLDARRVAGRRWTLTLAGGTDVHLPGDGLAGALAWLDAQAASGLLDRGLESIDLRVAGQLAVRGAPRSARTDNGGTPLASASGR